MRVADYELCDTPWKKFRGLMFRRKHEKPLLFVFSRPGTFRNSIHSLFVFFPFDAVWLDEDYRIVQVDRVRPFSLNVRPRKPAKYLLEMPAGAASGARIGERVELSTG